MWNKGMSLLEFVQYRLKIFFEFSDNISNGTSTNAPKPAPSVKDIIGLSLPYIGTYKKLDNVKQVVALIDDVSPLLIVIFMGQITRKFFDTAGSVHQLWKMLHGMQ